MYEEFQLARRVINQMWFITLLRNNKKAKFIQFYWAVNCNKLHPQTRILVYRLN